MIIAVDFDGTIVTSAYPRIGRWRFGAKRVLKWLAKRHILILWTCRVNKRLFEAVMFLEANGIYFHYVNENEPGRIRQYRGDCRKISADLYIDDKAGYIFWPLLAVKVLWMEGREWLRSKALAQKRRLLKTNTEANKAEQ